MNRPFIALFVLLFLPLTCRLQPALIIPGTEQVFSANNYMRVIEDAGHQYSFAEVSSPEFKPNWEKSSFNYSWNFSSSVFWTKITCHTSKAGEYIFYFDYNGMDRVDLFLVRDTIITQQSAGLEVPWKLRADVTNKIALRFSSRGDEDLTIYARIQPGQGMAFFPSYIAAAKPFESRIYVENIWSAIFYGMSVMMFISCLFSFGYTRDQNYLIYSLVALTHLVNRLSFSGHVDFILGNHPLWRHQFDALSQLVSMILVVGFMIRFLGTGVHFKWQHYGLLACIGLLALAIPVSFFNPGIGTMTGNINGPLIMIFSISAAVLRLRRHGYKPARYFLIGWGGFYVGVAFLLLSTSAAAPSWAIHGFEAGIIVEMIFFSMAVAENHQVVRRARQEAQSALIAQLKENDRIKDVANKELEQKVEERTYELSQKNKEVLDSIQYARRIQFTLLTHTGFIQQHLPETFILFRPKDIVSGDFYWAAKKGDLFFLSVCDCTGHGVPGAFMSLLSISFLSEAINEKNITGPHRILEYVREKLIYSLSQETGFYDAENRLRDGMDGTLLCFDLSTNEISYSAANNPPLIIRDGNIHELPYDKMPVGKGERQEPFNRYTIPYERGSTIYLHTDGYADQFGGPRGKKFKRSRLYEKLSSIATQPVKEQCELLETTFDNWKGTLEQVDDVCVIGVRL